MSDEKRPRLDTVSVEELRRTALHLREDAYDDGHNLTFDNYMLAADALEALADARLSKGFTCDCGISEELEDQLFPVFRKEKEGATSMKTKVSDLQVPTLGRVFAERVRLRRNQIEATQQGVADVVGISAAYLSQIENGHRNTSIEIAYRLAYALDASLDYLTGRGP